MGESSVIYKKLAVAFFMALGVFAAAFMLFSPTQSLLLGLIAFLVTLWTNEGLPLGVVSLLPIILFPIATPPNAIAMSSGTLKVSDMAKYGFVLNIAGILLVLFMAEFFWK